jgi:hypothetical protein
MSGLPNNRTPKLGPWPLGVNNLAPEGSLPLNEFGTRPVALREAENIDLSKEGRPSRRDGYTQLLSAQLAHSGWSAPGLHVAFFVDDGELMVFQADGTAAPLGAQVGNKPLSYSLIDGLVLFSNADVCGVVDRSMAVRPWAVPAPSGPPSVQAIDGYGMSPGQYQVAIAFIDDLGRESPLSETASVVLAQDQGLQLTVGEGFDGMLAVYTTHADDQVLRRGRVLPAAAGTTIILAEPANGFANTERVLAAIPPGAVSRYDSGRHWVAIGNTLVWSIPLRPGVFDPELSYATFDSPITMVEFVGAGLSSAGLYVGTEDEVWWLAGADPAQFRKVMAYPAGVVRGTPLFVPGKALNLDDADHALVFFTRDGQYCIGNASGNVAPVHVDRAALDVASEGASLYVERNGMKQIVTSLKGARPNGMATVDKAVAHVITSQV